MTVRTRAELNSDADTNLPDNTTGAISPADVRGSVKNIADSALLPEDHLGINAASAKTTPVDADLLGLIDSAASNVLKKVTWANIKATIWASLGVQINGGTGKTTPVDGDMLVLADSADSNNTKKLTWANLKATLKTYFDSLTTTLTNKRITPRITAISSSGTPTVNTDNCDMVDITALAAAITSMTTNLSGTPTNGQKLIYRIKDNGTARAISWGASFEARGADLPTTTVISKVLTVGFIYDTTTSKWGCVATVQEA